MLCPGIRSVNDENTQTPQSNAIWSEWVLERRFGRNRYVIKAAMDEYFYPVREKVLDCAKLSDHQLLLDVGCGDGLIAFHTDGNDHLVRDSPYDPVCGVRGWLFPRALIEFFGRVIYHREAAFFTLRKVFVLARSQFHPVQ
jgi:hypothetical protein